MDGVGQLYQFRLNQPDMPLEIDSDDEEAPRSPMSYLPSPGSDPAPQLEAQDYAQIRGERLQEALAGLDERSRSIVQQRWLAKPKRTLQDLAEEFGVSGERIRQIEAAAMKKLRVALV